VEWAGADSDGARMDAIAHVFLGIFTAGRRGAFCIKVKF